MISIQTAMKQEEIKELLGQYTGDDFSFQFKEKQGIKLVFDVTGEAELAAKKAKALIKETSWGNVLYFDAKAI